MTLERFEKSELKWTDSDYLCLFCYDPLYYHSQTKKEICVNPQCVLYPTNQKILQYDPNHSAVKSFDEEFNAAVKKCYMFSRQFFYNQLDEFRAIVCHDFFANNSLRFKQLLGINYLLVSLSKTVSWGNSINPKLCKKIILKCIEQYDELRLNENWELKNYMFTETNECYVMKYFDILVDIRKVLGITSNDQYGLEKVNSFCFIDKQAMVGKPSNIHDFVTMFKNYYPLVITMNHMFKYGYFISKIHQYPSRTSDLAMLFTLWALCEPTKRCSLNYGNLKNVYCDAMSQNNIQGDFDDFLNIYSSGEKFAPVIIYDGSVYRFDYNTLFIIMLYIFSLNKKIECPQILSGFQTLDEQRKISAKNFERAIREKFRKEKYAVYPENDKERFEPVFDGQKYEYDCIAIDESSKIIILIEVKYEDVAPSSAVGETIVKQVVLDKCSGILSHCKKQHERRRFFIKYCSKMNIGIKQFLNYKIISLIVTKHIPLIKKHLTTSVMSYNEFKDYNFKK